MPKAVKFFAFLAGTILVLFLLRWTRILPFGDRQILSISIFSMFIFGTLLYGEFRLAFAFGGIALLMACSLLTVDRFTESASLDVLVFLIGTFLVIGFLEESRFFEHVVSAIMKAVGPRPQVLLITLMILASLASALVGEVTAILFMAGAMLHLTNKYKLNPAPFVIMLVFACNNGSAMSSVGNPIGVLIALKTGLSFTDFLKDAAPVALVVDVVTFAICRWWFADAFAAFGTAVQEEFAARTRAVAQPAMAVASGDVENSQEIADQPPGGSGNPLTDSFYGADDPADIEARRAFRISWIILIGLVLLLVTHRQTETWLGELFHSPLTAPDGTRILAPDGSVIYSLREGTMMVGAALFMGCVVLFLQREKRASSSNAESIGGRSPFS